MEGASGSNHWSLLTANGSIKGNGHYYSERAQVVRESQQNEAGKKRARFHCSFLPRLGSTTAGPSGGAGSRPGDAGTRESSTCENGGVDEKREREKEKRGKGPSGRLAKVILGRNGFGKHSRI